MTCLWRTGMVRGFMASTIVVAATGSAIAQTPGRVAASPAASPIPATLNEQTYAPELVEAGRTTFAAQCGFCHGREATGGAGGTDLTRSELVAQDLRGDRISQVVRNGRPDTAMPAFPALPEDDLLAIVAFIHDQKSRAESAEGGRRSVETDDLLTGDVRAGRRYFAAECSGCHSAEGDLAGIASRMEGLRLLQQMLYPRPSNFGPAEIRRVPIASVTTRDGEILTGELEYEDEFTIAIRDESGRYRSFSKPLVEISIENPLDGHLELLGRYTDRDMHDLITYLHTLR